ncbi:hypothetical protein [Sphingomonas sp. 1P08PE]|uniref:hypothetical protein n=1 Tax=Sphingomonas sp. 1P08PE TaxID=554122 RepID=UPI0039A2DF43
MTDQQDSPAPAFGAWLARQTNRGGFVGQLAAAAASDRRFPKAGDPETVRAYLRGAMADGDMFDGVDDAEADWAAAIGA